MSLLLFISCSSDESRDETSIDSFVELNLDFYVKSTKDSNLIEEFGFIESKNSSSDPIFKILYDPNTESLNKILLSEKFLSENEISKKSLEFKFNKLYVENKSDPSEPELSEHASCIEWCNQNYTDSNGEKIKGRGKCKGNCWVDTTIRAIGELTSVISL